MTSWLAVAVLGSVLVGGCTTGGVPSSIARSSPLGQWTDSSPPDPATVELTIFAAASLTRALDTVQEVYEAERPGTHLTISTGSSAALATQIEEGAPADVFISADTREAQRLVTGGFASGEPVVIAHASLTIVVPSGNSARVASPADLARPGLEVIAAGDEVPITTYARQLVANLARRAGYPPDFEAAYLANIVSKEDSVRAVVGKIELGEGDAAIVYGTDAKASSKVAMVDVPAGANVRATFAGVVVGSSTVREAARTFLGWLAGPDGQAILSSFGFVQAGR